MNNTKEPDDVKRTLRRIETRLGIIQRTTATMFERVTGGEFPPTWFTSDAERAILAEGGPVTLDQLSARLEEYTEATAESLEALTERITRIEAQLGADGRHDSES